MLILLILGLKALDFIKEDNLNTINALERRESIDERTRLIKFKFKA